MASREPFTRHRGGDGGDVAYLGAYEYASATYGFRTPQELEEALTDELFVAYLDAAADRITADFTARVEAARLGAVFASNAKAHEKWRRQAHRAPGTHRKGLTGAALESAVMNVARMFPDNVIRGTGA